MRFADLRGALEAECEFQEIDRWPFTPVRTGSTSPHAYRLRSHGEALVTAAALDLACAGDDSGE